MQRRIGCGGGTRTLRAALVVAVAICTSFAERSEAALLQAFHSGGVLQSFWNPNNWIPAGPPGVGDTAEFNNSSMVSGLTHIYLGEVGVIPAQSSQISRLHFNGSSTTMTLDWGSPSGGPAGGLTFSENDPADFGVGVRVARIGGPSSQLITFLDAQNTSPQALTIAVGTDDIFSQGGAGNRLQLYASYPTALPTLHVASLLLEGAGSQLEIGQDVVVGSISATSTTGSQVFVPFGSLAATSAQFVNVQGANQVPLLVSHAGTAAIGTVTLSTAGVGNDATIRVGAPAPFEDGGVASFDVVEMFASEESRSAILVDAGGPTGVNSTPTTELTIDQLNAEAAGGTVELLVRNGGRLTVNNGLLNNDGPSSTGAASALRVLVDGPGSLLQGFYTATAGGGSFDFSNGGECLDCSVSVYGSGGRIRFESGAIASRGSFFASEGNVEFDDGATVNGSTLLLGPGSNATIADTASARFDSIQVNWVGGGPAPGTVTITAANPAVATTDVVAGTVHVAAQFFLFSNGVKAGGDSAFGSGSLDLRNGSRLRIGDDPLRSELPMLAIGSNGQVTLDATSSMFIGDALTAASYQAGRIVLDDGGYIRGNGLINGTGFTNTHPIVLNTGGDMASGFSPGTLTIDGEYIQQSGTLTLEIGGTNAGEFDVLDALQGASFLGGTIRFERINNFAGVLGAQFDFFAGRAVSFDPSLVIEDNSGFGLAFDFATGIATITQLAVPEPPIAALLAAGCVGLGWIGRRRHAPRVNGGELQ